MHKTGDVCLSCIYLKSPLTCQVHVKKSLSEVSLEMLCQAALGTTEDGNEKYVGGGAVTGIQGYVFKFKVGINQGLVEGFVF